MISFLKYLLIIDRNSELKYIDDVLRGSYLYTYSWENIIQSITVFSVWLASKEGPPLSGLDWSMT